MRLTPIENPSFPIDPYSTTYWQSSILSRNQQIQGLAMQPPRVPLQPINRQNTFPTSANFSIDAVSTKTGSNKPIKVQRLMPPEHMDEFKAAVQGNDLTKMGIVEVLKKQYVLNPYQPALGVLSHLLNRFPKQSKDTIKDTLDMVAERVGPTNSDKKWRLRDGF